MLSDDVAVARAPSRAYAALVARTEPLSRRNAVDAFRETWWSAMRRPALVVLVIGVASAISATGRVTATLVLSTMLLWSFVVGVQLAIGLALVTTARSRRVTVPVAIDLLFAGHLPWSLWICLAAGWHAADWPWAIEVAIGAALVALVWTVRILSAFTRVVLGASSGERWARLLAHQACTWFVFAAFVAATSGGWWRLLDP
jgi:hypothetical protein